MDSGAGGAHGDIRLYVEADLGSGAIIGLEAPQSHYLQRVMRRSVGDIVHLFNGRDGEWRGRIDGFGRGWCSIALVDRSREQIASTDIWLVFAPIKRARVDFLAEKATELGVSALWPMFTARTIVGRVNAERLRANAIEAAEQSDRLNVPEAIRSPVRSARVRPSTLAIVPPAATLLPSATTRVNLTSGSRILKAASARSSPATTPSLRATIAALP